MRPKQSLIAPPFCYQKDNNREQNQMAHQALSKDEGRQGLGKNPAGLPRRSTRDSLALRCHTLNGV
jgi:hypothetical protein